MGETRIPRENHRPATSHCQTWSHNVVSNTPHLNEVQTHTNAPAIGTDWIGSYKSNYHTITTIRGGSGGGGVHPVRAPLKLEKMWFFFWWKIVIFHTKYLKIFRAFLRSARFFLSAPPPNLKSWISSWPWRPLTNMVKITGNMLFGLLYTVKLVFNSHMYTWYKEKNYLVRHLADRSIHIFGFGRQWFMHVLLLPEDILWGNMEVAL